MKRLYFIRHGLSEMNKQAAFSGHSDTPLADEGHQQARLAGHKLKEEGVKIDIIVSSPLQRAHHTAQHVAKVVGYPTEEIILSDLFKERNYGALEGLHNQHPIFEGYREDESVIDEHEDTETLEELHQRAIRAHEYLQALGQDHVVVVAHGAIGRALYRVINDLPVDKRDIRYANAELVRFI